MAMLATNRLLIHVRSSEAYERDTDTDEGDLREAVVPPTSSESIPRYPIDPFSAIELRPSRHRTR